MVFQKGHVIDQFPHRNRGCNLLDFNLGTWWRSVEWEGNVEEGMKKEMEDCEALKSSEQRDGKQRRNLEEMGSTGKITIEGIYIEQKRRGKLYMAMIQRDVSKIMAIWQVTKTSNKIVIPCGEGGILPEHKRLRRLNFQEGILKEGRENALRLVDRLYSNDVGKRTRERKVLQGFGAQMKPRRPWMLQEY